MPFMSEIKQNDDQYFHEKVNVGNDQEMGQSDTQ